MPKEDYLLRYLEQLNRVIKAMLGFREKGFPEDALRLADETFREMLDCDIDRLAGMEVELFVETIAKAAYTHTYLETLAQLTCETAENYALKGDTEKAGAFYFKSLQLYKLLSDKDKIFSFEREMIMIRLSEKSKSIE